MTPGTSPDTNAPVAVRETEGVAGSIDTEGFCYEPLLDFSQVESREQLQEAVSSLSGRLGQEWPVIAGGQLLSGPPLISENPSDIAQTVGTVATATVADAGRAVLTASAALGDWSRRPVAARAG